MGLDTQIYVNFEFPVKKRKGIAHSDDAMDRLLLGARCWEPSKPHMVQLSGLNVKKPDKVHSH